MKKTSFIAGVSIVLLSLWALQTFFQSGLFETHDGRLHVTKLHWFTEALRQGHFPVRWIETANHQYGYPIFIFYYPLLYYLGSLFIVLGSSITTASKILLVSTYMFSGLLMFRLLREWFSPLASWVGAILYLFAPFRFVSLYVTGRWAESVSFAVVPLVFLLISKVYKEKDQIFQKDLILPTSIKFGAVAFALLILSHNAQALLFTPLILLFMFVLVRLAKPAFRRSLTASSLLLTALALGASAFFWLPALYELQWTHQGQKPVYDFRENFPSLRSYLYYPWGYGFSLTGTKDGVSPMIGLAQLVVVGLGVLGLLGIFGRIEKTQKDSLLVLLLVSGVAFFFMNRISLPLWENIPLLPSIQFPSRFSGILVFLIPIIAALSLDLMGKQWMKMVTASALVFLALYGNRNHLRAAVPDRFTDHDVLSIYQNIFGTGETAGENAPVWSQALPPPYENRKFEVLLHEREFRCPDVAIVTSEIAPRRYQLTVANSTNRSYNIQINTVYYPGWKASIDGKMMFLREPLTPKINPFGLIRIPVPSGTHAVRLLFTETPLRKTADAISLGTIAFLLTWPQERKKDDG